MVHYLKKISRQSAPVFSLISGSHKRFFFFNLTRSSWGGTRVDAKQMCRSSRYSSES